MRQKVQLQETKKLVEETRQSLTSRMLKSSSVYAISGVLRNLVSFVMLPIYTRYLTPADYGIVALMVFVVSLLEITLGARMGHAPQKFYHDQTNESDKKKVIATALFTTSFFSTLAACIAITQSEKITLLLYDNLYLSPVVSLFLVLIPTQAIEAIGLIYIRIQNRTSLFFWLSVVKLVVQVSANVVGIVILELGVLGMATATAFSAVFFAGIILLYVIRQTGITFSKELGIRMLIFTAPLWVSGAVSLYIGSSNRYVMNMYTDLGDIGLYSLAERLAAVLGLLIFTPFFNYWSAERFRLKDRPDFDELHREVFKGVYMILLAFGLGICVYGDFILAILTQEEFYPAVKALPFIILAYIFYSMSQFYQFSFLHVSKTNIITRIMNITAIAATVLNFSLIPKLGFVGAAMSFMFSYLIILILSHYYSSKFYDMKLPLNSFILSIPIVSIGYYFSGFYYFEPFSILGFVFHGACFLITVGILIAINFDKRQLSIFINIVKNRSITTD